MTICNDVVQWSAKNQSPFFNCILNNLFFCFSLLFWMFRDVQVFLVLAHVIILSSSFFMAMYSPWINTES